VTFDTATLLVPQRANPTDQSRSLETLLMTGSALPSDLARTTASEFERYFRHMAARVEQAARSVTEQQLWTKPFPFGNSIGHLILHITGNLNHFIGAIVGGSGYVRQRAHEFTDPEHHPLDDLLKRFHEAIDMVARTLESQNESSFLAPVAEREPIQTRLGLFLVCAAHMNNHIGQMSYLVQAFQTNVVIQTVSE
jgi:uncharacterized damage-inducible protein DinB